MKNYTYLVNKQFQVNKRRNIFTLMGIALGIILFITVNYMNCFIKDISIEESKHLNGDYHVAIKDINTEKRDSLLYNAMIEQCGFYNLKHSSKVTIKDTVKNLYIYELDENSLMDLFSPALDLIEGRFPYEDKELMLSSEAKSEMNIGVGQEIAIEDERYTLVGFFESRNSIPSAINGITSFEGLNSTEDINAVIRIKNKEHIYNESKKILSDIGISSRMDLEKISYNQNIFYVLGENLPGFENDSMQRTAIIGFINIFILILTIILTYGAINVSMKERIQQFSLLRCIGASSDKIRYLLIKEGLILGGVVILPGLVIGHLIAFIIIKVVIQGIIQINLFDLGLPIYWQVILNAIMLTFCIIFIASIIPVLQAGKISPLSGIVNGGTPIKKVKKYNSKLIRKILGYEGEIAYKNIRENNRNFIITTVMLSSLLITFVGFTSYYSVAKEENLQKEKLNNKNVTIEYSNFKDTTVSLENYDKVEAELELAENCKRYLEDTGIIKDIKFNIRLSMPLIFEEVQSNKILPEEYEFQLDGKKYFYSKYGSINIYDEEALEKVIPYIKGEKVKKEDFINNGIIIINPLVRTMGLKKEVKSVFKPFSNKEVTLFTEKIQDDSLYYNSTKDGLRNTLENSFAIKGKILGTIDYTDVIDSSKYVNPWALNIIVSSEFYKNNKEIFNNEEFRGGNTSLSFSYKTGAKGKENVDTIMRLANEFGGWYEDYEEQLNEFNRHLNGMAVLIYISLFLTMSIGILNILNNKLISIQLRRREFGACLAMGMSRKKLKKIIIMEGILQWGVATIIGSTISYILVKIIYLIYVYNGILTNTRVPIWSILIGGMTLLIVNLMSNILSLKSVNSLVVTELLKGDE